MVRLVAGSGNVEEKLDCRNTLKEEMIEFYNTLIRGHDTEENVKVSSKYYYSEDQKNDCNTDRNSVASING